MPTEDELTKARRIQDLHEAHCREMRQLAVHAWQRAERLRRELYGQLYEVCGEPQPIPDNPYPRVLPLREVR